MPGLRAPVRTGALDPHALDGRNCRQPFLIGRDNTLPLEIWGRLRRGITPEINAISTIIFLFSLMAIVLWYRLRTRTEGTEVTLVETADERRLAG